MPRDIFISYRRDDEPGMATARRVLFVIQLEFEKEGYDFSRYNLPGL